MKTTIEISNSLFKELRKYTAEHGITIKAAVENALRFLLSKQKAVLKVFHLKDASFGGEGLQSGVSLSDWSDIRKKIYEDRGG